MAGGGRVKSESSQGENKTYSIHVEGDLKRFPGREHEKVLKFLGTEHQNVLKFLGEGKSNRGREFENIFKFPWGEFENVFKFPGGGGTWIRGNLKTLHRDQRSKAKIGLNKGLGLMDEFGHTPNALSSNDPPPLSATCKKGENKAQIYAPLRSTGTPHFQTSLDLYRPAGLVITIG